MSSKPFPDSHTTQTSATTTTTTTTVIVRPYLEFSYIRTVPGILKIVELVKTQIFCCFSKISMCVHRLLVFFLGFGFSCFYLPCCRSNVSIFRNWMGYIRFYHCFYFDHDFIVVVPFSRHRTLQHRSVVACCKT